ncbi:MAG: SRPBCC domain-containing protein [Saprospiraceae bacterium]|nr:SRPBCC domain-containing protein [Saprospiraceae bacterium]
MKRFQFSIAIDAPADKVWWTLWNDPSYRQWARVFHEGSYAVSDWKQGSKIHFLAPGGDGMFSIIEECRPGEVMKFKHLGVVKDFKEQPENDEMKQWSGAIEMYTLTHSGGTTTLLVEIDIVESHADFFNETFPKALQAVKQLAENFALIVTAQIQAPIEKVWACWTSPEHITKWCQASDDWHAPYAENDLSVGGKFKTTMAAKDGSVSFDFEGAYTAVEPLKTIAYTLADDRKVRIAFSAQEGETRVVETFEPENMNSWEMQQAGWQAILDNFKKHAEGLTSIV